MNKVAIISMVAITVINFGRGDVMMQQALSGK